MNTTDRNKNPEVSGKKGIRALVVDDSENLARVTAIYLEMNGCHVAMANDGGEALRLAEEFSPDLILMDIGLPDLSGHEVAKKIREQSWGKDMTLIAVTGWGKPQDEEKSLEAGFNQHLTKPFELEDLQKIVDTARTRRQLTD